jgi:hypothetical protein
MENKKKLLHISIMLVIALVSGQIFGMRNPNENPMLTDLQRDRVWNTYNETQKTYTKALKKLDETEMKGNKEDIEFWHATLERQRRIKSACHKILFGLHAYTDKEIEQTIYPS